ncbi:hypothetical protein GRX01_18490 [Halobaculum sp. WSA2]|uniref:Amino acid/polyamine/organocation transporter, APC superfamily n=1 Tax=Halobaculum saliterrae TaxID=2073113 RepID=A0A6B0SWN8_9EURY|nr:hypothetical protein [Halobaculum saliterrae]MXR43314.1 hypothetical protein [Halobaculum saliterrae]
MDTGRLRRVVRGTARPAGVGIAAMLGGGLLYLPNGVAQGAGPQAPLAYLLAGGGAVCLAVAFAVVAAGPFDERGPVYGPVARVWDSRRLGALTAWGALAGYVALLALLAEWLGRLAPLPASTGAYVSGTLGAPTGLAALSGVGFPGPLVGDALAATVCLLALGIHLAGTRRAAVAAAVPAWGVVLGVGALLLAAFLPGIGEFVPANFDPLYPTSGLRRAPLRSLVGGVGVALFTFVGVEAAAYAAAADRDEMAGGGRDGDAASAPVVAAAVAGALVTLAAFVALGVIDWTRLTLADIPAADAVGAYLPVNPVVLTVVVSTGAGLAALVALGVPAARTIAGLGELYPPLERGPTEPPVVALVVVYGAAAALAVADLVAPALYVAVPGLALSYLAVATTAAAMPVRRPDLWAECGVRPTGALGRVALAGAVAVAAALFGVTLASDPATTLGLTLHRVALSVFEFELVSDPLGGIVPAIVAWELIGLGLLLLVRDYRESAGIELPALGGPAENDRRETDSSDPTDSTEATDPADEAAPEP